MKLEEQLTAKIKEARHQRSISKLPEEKSFYDGAIWYLVGLAMDLGIDIEE